ncbi:MAG TPA: transglutaminase domain-containing protein, partial [Thermoanaerobaculia bacterium]|nr:transglutaminase domain-containing protein [Thermoanaerobaculia bacterium]
GQAPEVQTFLHAAAVPAASRRETIDRILARLGAEVRYTGVELGEGGIIPRSPADTLRHKFGDCKDKAVLLAALLRALDIPAHVALLKSGERSLEVEETLPGMGAFNHAIVVLPGTPEIWIDPTDRYSRAGELPVSDQGRLALIATPATSGLVRTPEATAADNRVAVTREFVLSDYGPAQVVESDEFWGEPERDMRVHYATQSEKAVHEMLTEHLRTAFLTDQIGKADHSDPADLARPFHTRVEVKDAPRGFTDMQSAVVAFFPTAAIRGLPDELTAEGGEKDGKPAPRQTEYSIPAPFRREIRYRAVPPAGFKAEPPPPGRVRHFGPATLSEEYAVADDGALTATLRFEIDKRRLTAAEFDALRDGVREASKESPLLLKFEQVGEAHLAAGRVREGIAELRRLAGLEPKKALPRMRLARALLAGGMGEVAREEARRAVALEPAFGPAYSTLAWILQHDEVGRSFGKGFDRAGAIAAYRKAKELEPKEDAIRVNLAILLEYDDKGRHYAVDLAPAIDEYRALQADLNKHGHDDNLLVALLQAGRFAEMKELLAKIEESEMRSTLRLVAIAATESADAAVAQAERSFPDGAKRQGALLQAAQTLVVSRRYPAAAALLAAAARQAPNAAEILARADLLRKVRPHEEMVLSLDDPADVVKRFLLLFLGSDSPEMAQIEPLIAHELDRELGDEEKTLHSFKGDFGAFRRTLGTKTEVSPAVVADVSLALFHTTVTGDAATGYRVALSSPFAKEDIAVFLVQEGGKPKLAGSGEAVESLGLEAFLHVQRGDLKGARQWLDWARQEIGSAGGDDPLAAPPFTALWTQGAEATADEARCAAASLLAGSEASGKALPILLACRDAAPEGARRTAFDLSLALADQALKKPADTAAVARRLIAAFPRSKRAYHLLEGALVRLGSWDELHRFAEERLAAAADDPLPALSLYTVAVHQGDLGEAERRLRKIVDQGKAGSGVFNDLAWLALVRGKVDDKAIEAGQRATTLSHYKDPNSLHILASLYAEQGKTAEAYQLILQALAERATETPDAGDWYVFGRLAEHYGLPEAARRYYTRIPAPPQPGATDIISTYTLARRRLAALGPEPKAKRGE